MKLVDLDGIPAIVRWTCMGHLIITFSTYHIIRLFRKRDGSGSLSAVYCRENCFHYKQEILLDRILHQCWIEHRSTCAYFTSAKHRVWKCSLEVFTNPKCQEFNYTFLNHIVSSLAWERKLNLTRSLNDILPRSFKVRNSHGLML